MSDKGLKISVPPISAYIFLMTLIAYSMFSLLFFREFVQILEPIEPKLTTWKYVSMGKLFRKMINAYLAF